MYKKRLPEPYFLDCIFALIDQSDLFFFFNLFEMADGNIWITSDNMKDQIVVYMEEQTTTLLY